MQKQKMVELENQIFKLKQIIEKFEQDKISQDAQAKQNEQDRNKLAVVVQELKKSHQQKC